MGRKNYSEGFKDRAIEMALEPDKTIKEVSEGLGVSTWTLSTGLEKRVFEIQQKGTSKQW